MLQKFRLVGTYNFKNSRTNRSARDAYFAIIEAAQTFIYIEDQNLVNLEVAEALNKKIRDRNFNLLMFAIQNSIETAGIFIPNRKRRAFMEVVLRNTTDTNDFQYSSIQPTHRL